MTIKPDFNANVVKHPYSIPIVLNQNVFLHIHMQKSEPFADIRKGLVHLCDASTQILLHVPIQLRMTETIHLKLSKNDSTFVYDFVKSFSTSLYTSNYERAFMKRIYFQMSHTWGASTRG